MTPDTEHPSLQNTDADMAAAGLTEQEQRELLVWFWENKQALVIDTICKNCRERNDYHNYCENHIERLK